MKKLIFGLILSLGIVSCAEQEPEKYTGQKLEFELFKSSDFNYSGNLTVNELTGGDLEFEIQLDGAKSQDEYVFPAHLHFGGYDAADAPIAYLLNSVSAKDLKSVTVLGQLSDGTTLNFEAMKAFDGHLKVHLANDGPDYEVILVAGNVGGNLSNEASFDPSKIAVCGKSY